MCRRGRFVHGLVEFKFSFSFAVVDEGETWLLLSAQEDKIKMDAVIISITDNFFMAIPPVYFT